MQLLHKIDEVESDLPAEAETLAAVEETVATATHCLFTGCELDWISSDTFSAMFKQENRWKGVAVANNNNNQTAESSSQALYTDGRAQPSGRVKQVKIKREATDEEGRRFDGVSKQSKQNHCKTENIKYQPKQTETTNQKEKKQQTVIWIT